MHLSTVHKYIFEVLGYYISMVRLYMQYNKRGTKNKEQRHNINLILCQQCHDLLLEKDRRKKGAIMVFFRRGASATGGMWTPLTNTQPNFLPFQVRHCLLFYFEASTLALPVPPCLTLCVLARLSAALCCWSFSEGNNFLSWARVKGTEGRAQHTFWTRSLFVLLEKLLPPYISAGF